MQTQLEKLQEDFKLLEVSKQSCDILLAAKDASLDQWKEDFAAMKGERDSLVTKVASMEKRVKQLHMEVETSNQRCKDLLQQRKRKFMSFRFAGICFQTGFDPFD